MAKSDHSLDLKVVTVEYYSYSRSMCSQLDFALTIATLRVADQLAVFTSVDWKIVSLPTS